jgi:hypothetical protein
VAAQAVALAALLDQLDEQIGQRQRLAAQRGHAAIRLGLGEHVQPALQHAQGHGLRAADSADAGAGW